MWIVGGLIPIGGNRNSPKEYRPSATWSTTNPKSNFLGLNAGLRGEGWTANRLAHGRRNSLSECDVCVTVDR